MDGVQPSSPEGDFLARYTRACVFANARDYDEAYTECESALAVNTEAFEDLRFHCLGVLSEVAAKTGEWTKAISAARAAYGLLLGLGQPVFPA